METLLLYPVFVQIALMAVLHVMMGRARVGSIKSGEVKVKDIALRQPNWTPRARPRSATAITASLSYRLCSSR